MIKQKARRPIWIVCTALSLFMLSKSLFAGIITAAFCWYIVHEIQGLEKSIEILTANEKDSEKNISEKVVITGMCKNFSDYRGFTIENFGDKLFRVTAPNGNQLETIYPSIQNAKKDIDELAVDAERPVYSRRKVQNIRFVR